MAKKKQQKSRKRTTAGRNWIVTTSGKRAMKDIARDLEKAGFAVGQVNDEIQSISGAAGAQSVKKLRKISGVIDVSPDTPIDIGPPDSTETW